MRIDMLGANDRLDHAAELAEAEALGLDGVWVGETSHDAFVTLALAAREPSGLMLGTNVAVALARNPMTFAIAANDVQLASRGRLMLGIGSQVAAHVQRRFSMPWSHPAARMAEFVRAVRAIWDAWAGHGPLRFEGEFYRHTLMPPLFDPGPNPWGTPPLLMAAVGRRMTELCGEVADGIMLHPLMSVRYLSEQTIPALRRGRERAESRGDSFEVSALPLVATGATGAEVDRAVEAARARIGFYGSTPAYAPIFELHGWGAVQQRLVGLARESRWAEQAPLVDDGMLGAFAVVGNPREVGRELIARYAPFSTRLTPYFAVDVDLPTWSAVVMAVRSAALGSADPP